MIENALLSICQRLNINKEDMVIIYPGLSFGSIMYLNILDYFEKYLINGTIGVFGDNNLNQNVIFDKEVLALNNQKLSILVENPMFRLLSIKPNVSFYPHPAIIFNTIGEFSTILCSYEGIDFPYGKDSLFNEMYHQNAVVLFDDVSHHFLETIFSYSFFSYTPIKKNTTLSNQEIISYLDYDVKPFNLFETRNTKPYIIYEEFGNQKIYAYRYKDIIDILIRLIKQNHRNLKF